MLLYYNHPIAQLFNLFDNPDKKRKFHKKSVPITGGILIISNLLFFLLFLKIFNLNEYKSEIFTQPLIFVAMLFFIIGVIDDKISINANLKFILTFILISGVLIYDSSLILNNINFQFVSFNLKYWSLPWTIICFLLFINAFNMFDGYNLQSASYSFFIFIIFFLKSNYDFLFLIILISIIFFSYLNYFSKSFMGDGGTYALGFLIGVFAIKLYNFNYFQTVDEIVLLMIIPGIDLMRLFCQRIIKYKRSPFSADRKHLHHLLSDKFGWLKTFFIMNSLIVIPFLIGEIFSIHLQILFIQILIYFVLLYKINSLSIN